MNYAPAYTPNYAPAAAYAQSPYDAAAFAQAQQHAAALDQIQQMYAPQQYPMALTGQFLGAPGGFAATAPKLTPLQGAWWQESMWGMPRWSIAAGAAALAGIGLAWQAGVFGKMGGGRSMSRTTVRRSTARDASPSRGGARKSASSSAERDMSRRKPKRRRAGASRRRRR